MDLHVKRRLVSFCVPPEADTPAVRACPSAPPRSLHTSARHRRHGLTPHLPISFSLILSLSLSLLLSSLPSFVDDLHSTPLKDQSKVLEYYGSLPQGAADAQDYTLYLNSLRGLVCIFTALGFINIITVASHRPGNAAASGCGHFFKSMQVSVRAQERERQSLPPSPTPLTPLTLLTTHTPFPFIPFPFPFPFHPSFF